MGKRKKKNKASGKRRNDRPIVKVETTCSIEVDWHLVTAYPCNKKKGKYSTDLTQPLSPNQIQSVFIDFLEALFPIEKACLTDNVDKEAIAGQQGNNLARQSFDLRPFPAEWLRTGKLGYVIIYQSNALLSAYQEREQLASIIEEFGWENATYEKVAEKMQEWFDSRKEKTTSKKKKESARNSKKPKKGKKQPDESRKNKRYSLSRNLFANVQRSGEHPKPPELDSPFYDFARGAAELCSPARYDENDKNVIWYDAVPLGDAIYTLRIDLSKILPQYPHTSQIARPRLNCKVEQAADGSEVFSKPVISLALTQSSNFNLRRFKTIIAWDIGSDWNNGGCGAKFSRNKNGYETGRPLGISAYTISLIQHEKKLCCERDRLIAAIKRKDGKHECDNIKLELERVRNKLSNLRETIDWRIASDIVEHASIDEPLVLEDLRWSIGTPSYRHGRIHEHVTHLCAKRGWLCISVNAAHTSNTCSSCSHKNTKKTPLGGDRLFRCESCDEVIDRDFNASVNIAMRGFDTLDKMLHSRGFFSGNSVKEKKCAHNAAESKKRGERVCSKRKSTPRRRSSTNHQRRLTAITTGAGASVEMRPVHPGTVSVVSGRCSGFTAPLASNANPVCDAAVSDPQHQRKIRFSFGAEILDTSRTQQIQHF